jgi:hypothetical protein
VRNQPPTVGILTGIHTPRYFFDELEPFEIDPEMGYFMPTF